MFFFRVIPFPPSGADFHLSIVVVLSSNPLSMFHVVIYLSVRTCVMHCYIVVVSPTSMYVALYAFLAELHS